MSYTIEYNKQVFYTENEDKQKIYFLFIRQGDNNVWDAHTNLRAKDWFLSTVGTEKELWKEIGRRLGSINGGGLQKAQGWGDAVYFTPEEYIKQYRSKIKNAKPLEKMLESFRVYPFISIREIFENESDKEREVLLRQFIEKYDMKEMGSDYYSPERIQHRTELTDVEGLKDFFMNMPRHWNSDFHTGYGIEKEVKRRHRGRW